MRIKRVLNLALLALMLTACGNKSSSIDADIDKNKAESVAQNLQQAMTEKTSAAVPETTVTSENVTEQKPIEADVLDIDDLPGTWLMVGGEIEGDIWEAIPGYFESLVFTSGIDPKGEDETIYADTEARDSQGFLNVNQYQEMIERLDEPVYEGCGNEEWSIRIGEESEKDEDGYPKYKETYATLLDENTLLRQVYFTIDGAPCVSYQTFKRAFPGQDVEYLNVEELHDEWELVAYVDENGEELSIPNELTDLSIDLDGEISWTDTERSIDFVYPGDWRSGRGGSFLTLSEEHEAWFAGAVARIETDSEEIAQMRLYHKGGWLCLKEKEHSEIPVLDVLKTTLSREEHNDDQLICSAIRDSVRLSDEDAEQYPELAKSLAAFTQEKIEYMEASAEQMKDIYGEGDPDFESYFSDEELLFVQRADSRVFSVREEFYSYSGGIHPMFGAVGHNYDTQTGKKLELTDVVTDFDQMLDLVEKKLFETYDKEMFYHDVDTYFEQFIPEEMEWTLGYQGITFHFIPYSVAPYAAGMFEITIWFHEAPELFVEYYTQVPDTGHVISVPLGREYEFDRDVSDGWSDLIYAYAESSNDYAFDKLTITLNGETYADTEICLSEIEMYLVCSGEAGNSKYYLYIYGGIEDGHKMYIYDLNQKQVKRLDLEQNVFFPGEWYSEVEKDFEVYHDPVFTDPTDFTMQTRMWNMGLFLGEKDYYVDPDTGSMVSRKASFSIPESTWPITSKVPLELESLVEKEMVEFPAGSIFYYNRTDGVSYVDVRSELGVDYRIPIDTSGDYTTVNGMSVEECFDGVTKIW